MAQSHHQVTACNILYKFGEDEPYAAQKKWRSNEISLSNSD